MTCWRSLSVALAFGAVLVADTPEQILSRSCAPCHQGAKPQAKLRLDTLANAAQGGASGPVIVPGKSAGSLLYQRVSAADKAVRMPPGGTALPPEAVRILKDWIDQGAPGLPVATAKEEQKHWAYRKPVKPAAKSIDELIAAKLREKGLSFSPPASKETLIRRVSLDLVGLPPTPAEVKEFLADNRPDAYSRLVDRLLASPHYGERWARHWLDLARYADTHGYEKDDRRMMWKYRDWVIDAFNRDMPFDQFTVEQLAGDMLPDATESQKIATGFHRNTMLNEEGGVDKDESFFEVLVDRVNTTGTVFLGSTIGCSQCHTHKYDPFTHKEYYQMMAFFSNSQKKAEPYGTGAVYREPVLDLATADQESKRQKIKARIEELDKRLKTQTPELDREQAAWERTLLQASKDWKTLQPSSVNAEAGTKLATSQDGIVTASGDVPQRETYTVEAPAEDKKLTGLRIEAIPDPALPRGGPGRDVYGNFIITDVQVEVGGQPLKFKRIVADDGRINPKSSGTRQLWTIDASQEEKRLPRQMVLVPEAPVAVPKGATIRIRLVQNSDFNGQTLGRFRISITAAADPVVIAKVKPKLRPVLETSPAQRTPEAAKELSEAFRTVALSLEPVRDELKERKSELDKLGVTTAMIMQERAGFERPSDHVRIRGAFSNLGEKVYADVPAALGPLPASELPNRLGLARWIASRDNPLTARVAINRIWEHYFGRGIVETTEDFGTQGERPSNQNLLDWLAVEFMDRGWSLKAMHKLIVMSQAYQQTSHVTPELLQMDPYNRLISRGPRFRMEAEMIRDTGLAASGLLSSKLGGPSVFPPQPPGIWDIPYNDDKWEESKGEDRYRRGIYTFIRRSALYPSMMNFDATSREFCTVRRSRTNTPLAALTTLNDAAFFEMAQAFGKRMLAEGGSTDSERVAYGFRLATSRVPKSAEQDRLLTWFAGEQKYFASHPNEVAGGAWTMLANVLLNLDEAITKE